MLADLFANLWSHLNNVFLFLHDNAISVGDNRLSLLRILKALISVGATVLLALWASAALDKRLMRIEALNTSLRLLLSRLGRSVLVVLAVLISLQLVGIDLTILSIFGGALGVGLGLGLQRIASNYVSGFIILLEGSLSINDLITVDKYSGKVTKINTRYTILKGFDGVEAIIPNEMLISSPVQNLSLTEKEVVVTTNVTVAYGTDIEELLPLLVNVVGKVKRISTISPPSAHLVSFGANGLDLRIGFWVLDPENGSGAVLSEVNLAVWKLLQERKIEVPYPQTEIKILNPGELNLSES